MATYTILHEILMASPPEMMQIGCVFPRTVESSLTRYVAQQGLHQGMRPDCGDVS